MALTPADKTFLAATISLDAKRDHKAIVQEYRAAYGDAVKEAKDKALWYRIRQLWRLDEAKDYQAGVRATAQAATGQAVAERAALALKIQMALEQGDLDMIEAMRDVASNAGESGSAKAKAAEAFWKRRAQSPAEPGVSAADVEARAVQERKLDEEIEALVKEKARQMVEKASPPLAPAPTSEPVFKGQAGGVA